MENLRNTITVTTHPSGGFEAIIPTLMSEKLHETFETLAVWDSKTHDGYYIKYEFNKKIFYNTLDQFYNWANATIKLAIGEDNFTIKKL